MNSYLRHPLQFFLLLIGFTLGASVPALGQGFEVPDGFVTETVKLADGDGQSSVVMRVKPLPGTFSDLSSLDLRPIRGPIDDPGLWLQDQMKADLSGLDVLDDVFDSPDTPFEGSMFEQLRSALEGLGRQFSKVGELPLEFCDDPTQRRNTTGTYTELSCDFDMGPVHKYTVLRLQEVDGVWYYAVIDTMNERRLRHLVAIANSFRVD